MLRLLFTYLFLFLLSISHAQEMVYPKSIHAKLGYGALVPHRSMMHHLVTGHASLLELSLNFNSYGQHNFDHPFLLPSAGISTVIIQSGNPDEIGNCYGAYTYFSLPLSKKSIIPKLRMGAGFGIVSKPFDAEKNQKNNAIGSYLNTCILIELENKIKISDKLSWMYSASVTHFSNGSYVLPNLGLNFLTLNTGVSYAFGDKKTISNNYDYAFDKSFHFDLLVYGGAKSNSTHHPGIYPVISISAEGSKRLSFKSKMLFGADVFYNSSIEHLDEYEHLKENVDYLTKSSNIQSGVFVGYGLVFDQLMISIQNGFYIRNEYKESGLLYHRFSIKRTFNDKWIANIGLKSHFAVAEYVEFGVGYKIK